MADKKPHPTRGRAQKLHKRYGISEADYNQMLAAQQGRCGICHRYRQLIVDHSHATEQVRGLLCSHCNSALGFFEESIEALQSAIAYITVHAGEK